MPDLDGYEAAAQLRRIGIRTPILALTAHAQAFDRQKCLDAGCDEHLTKPINVPAMFRALSRYLQPSDEMRSPTEHVHVTADSGQRFASTKASEPLIAEILPAYIEDLTTMVSRLRTMVASDDAVSLARALHMLKGSGESYGFVRISELANAAERRLIVDLERVDEATQEIVADLVGYIERIEGFPARASGAR